MHRLVPLAQVPVDRDGVAAVVDEPPEVRRRLRRRSPEPGVRRDAFDDRSEGQVGEGTAGVEQRVVLSYERVSWRDGDPPRGVFLRLPHGQPEEVVVRTRVPAEVDGAVDETHLDISVGFVHSRDARVGRHVGGDRRRTPHIHLDVLVEVDGLLRERSGADRGTYGSRRRE
jgi:hypothetical protein